MNTGKRLGLAAILLFSSTLAQADWSANLGWASEYHFRGLFQHSSSASGGVDFEQDGFYAGAWAADVGDGLEVDGYFGYGGEYEDFTYLIGFTGYYYTGDFDDTYQEINLGFGYNILSVDVAIGEYENFTGPTQDYTYYALTLAQNGFYGTFAGFSQDADGDYLELGYGTTVSDIELGIALIFASDDLLCAPGDPLCSEDESLIITVGKSFDLQ
ncbi:MAG: TorF family putative porin [Gammaproteobacteria bacterium]|nr:TorF family putative porin [Gammaproteobacteria bacterium]